MLPQCCELEVSHRYRKVSHAREQNKNKQSFEHYPMESGIAGEGVRYPCEGLCSHLLFAYSNNSSRFLPSCDSNLEKMQLEEILLKGLYRGRKCDMEVNETSF